MYKVYGHDYIIFINSKKKKKKKKKNGQFLMIHLLNLGLLFRKNQTRKKKKKRINR